MKQIETTRQPSEEDIKNLIKKCTFDIEFFVNDMIIKPYNEATGENYFITRQQQEGLIEFQKLVLDKMAGKRHDILGVSIMSGKGCHAKGTSVMMEYGGCRAVENIQVGDKLMGNDGTSRTVLELKRGREQMYRISVSDGSYYDVNESHILSLRACETGQRGSLKWGDIVNVPVKEYITWSDRKKKSYCVYKVPVEFEKQDVKIDPYILGCWIGDGDSNSARLINTDKAVIDAWKEYGESLGLTYKCYAKIDHRIIGKHGYSNAFLDLLRHYNLIDNKHIPADYILNDRNTRLQLLAGIIDTDGCVRKKGAYGISTKHLSLAKEIVFLARSLGFRASLKTYERIKGEFKKKLQIEHVVNISRGDTEEIPVRIKRKKAVQSQRKDLNFTFKVEKLEVDDYYGFELDGNHLYVLGDFSVTHNTGKDAATTWIIMWFMFCFNYPKVPCVSVTAEQLKTVLWSELAKWFNYSRLKDFFSLQADKFYRKDVPADARGRRWFAFTKAANPKMSAEEQMESLAGIHEEFLLQVLDECSGIMDVVPQKLEENMTQAVNLMWVIFNPMHAKGYAIDTQYAKSKYWVALRWNAEESEITNKEKHKRLLDEYGRDSNPYRMAVLGLPPINDEKTLIPWEWIQDAINKDLTILPTMPMVASLDCGAGGDNSIIASKRGGKVFPFRKFSTDDSVKLSNWCGNFIDTENPDVHRVDTVGIGWAIGGDLEQKKGSVVQSADSRRMADNTEMFTNKRAEMFWNLREEFRKGAISIPDDPDLKNQLSVIKFDTDAKGKIFIMAKKDIKKELGGNSPNEADALAMLYYEKDDYLSKVRRYKPIKYNTKGTWQAA